MILSRIAECGLRVTLFLASRSPQNKCAAPEISDALQIESHLLEVVLRKLRQAGILESEESQEEGLSFARSTSEITLQDVIVALEGWNMFNSCILGLPGCGERDPCPLHDQWGVERERLAQMFQRSTLEDASKKICATGLKLTFE